MVKRDVNDNLDKETIRLQLLASMLAATNNSSSKNSRALWSVPWQRLVKMVKTLQ